MFDVMIIILDYGVGNLNSIKNMIKKVGFVSEISSDPEVVAKGTKFILPGVGSFSYGMTKLRSTPYFKVLEQKVLKEKIPILGVCLGAQLLFEESEEGGHSKGLGWIKGRVTKFKYTSNEEELKIPHMGWNFALPVKKSRLLDGLDENARFYFVHSYHFNCSDKDTPLLTTVYGQPFISAVEKENVIGVQFHPEKSHKFGMQLYKNFLNYY